MHIRSKFDGAKQINRSQSGSWESRCAGAALRVNEGPEWGPTIWEKITKCTSNDTFRTVSASKNKILAQDNKRKATEEVKLQRKRRRSTPDSQQGRLDYSGYDNKGPNAVEVPMDLFTDKLHDLMVEYYEAHVKVTETAAKQIYTKTMGQSNGECEHEWLEERRKRITSSNVGQIAKRRSTTKVTAKVKQLLYTNFHGNRATDWGLLQEDVSRVEYLKVKQISSPGFAFETGGLVVSVMVGS